MGSFKPVRVYWREGCYFCYRAKALLEEKKIPYESINITQNPERREEMIDRTKRKTYPQILIDGKPIGGCDDLYKYEVANELDFLVAAT